MAHKYLQWGYDSLRWAPARSSTISYGVPCNSPSLNRGGVCIVSAITPDATSAEAKTIFYPATASTQVSFGPTLFSTDYQGLGYALREMNEAGDEDDWKINDQVFRNACYVAGELMSIGAQAPKLFSHSPTSVVFDWTDGGESRYLTVSANYLSVLVSTPTRIERRNEYPWNAILQNGVAAGLLAGASKEGFVSYKLLTAETNPNVEEPAA